MNIIQKIRIQNILQNPVLNIFIIPTSILHVISNQKDNPIYHIIYLSKNILNNHYNEKIKKTLNVIKDWMNIQLFCPIPDLADNSSKIKKEFNQT